MKPPPLTREQVASVIEGRSSAPRVPMVINSWVLYPDRFEERQPALLEILRRYPLDAQITYLAMPALFEAPEDDPEYRWFHFDDPYKDTRVPFDQRIALADWSQLDDVLKHFPDPHYPGLFKHSRPPDGRYRLGIWWDWLFERHWHFRGMTNALMDYYDHPEDVHRLFRAVTDFYLVVLERVKKEAGLDGVMISDDLGTQKSLFFSPKFLDRFFRPYYQEVLDKAHALGLHVWLHACGCMDAALPMFIDLGLDVIHPIQKYAMDYQKTVDRFGSRICFYTGVDVQRVIPFGTPEEVRAEVRHVIDTFWRPEGRLVLASSNALNEDCPLPNLEALLDEAHSYGTEVVSRQGE